MATIRGTRGDDRLIGDDEDDDIFGLAGNDVIRGRGGNDDLRGGPGDDLIFGQGGGDRIFGHAGNDELRGGAGNDRIAGGLGADRIFGGPGDDRIFGQGGNDTLGGNAGNDLIGGGGGNDRIFGHLGSDDLFGHGGNDRIAGGPGNDLIAGGGGNDRMLGQGGDDDLRGGPGNDRIVGGLGNDRIVGHAGADILTGGPGADRFVYRSLSDAGDVITDFTPDDGDLLALAGSLRGAEEVRVADGDDTVVAVRPSGEQTFTELVVLRDFVGPIDVWYGDVQSFGDPGVPQRWVNVLGNVETDGLASLSYSLNGEDAQTLAFAATSSDLNRRLFNEGDFNVELDFAELDPSAAHDLVTIRAAFDNGDVLTRDVLIDFEGGKTWPTDFSIDWSQVDDPQDVVQVVDGLWSFDDNGARPLEIGYDRVLAIGDQTWDNYEVQFSVDVHTLTHPTIDGAALWFGMQWSGHTEVPGGAPPPGSPHPGHVPGATFMIQENGMVLRPSEFFPTDVDGDGELDNSRVGSGATFEDGETFEFLIRNERDPNDNDLSDGLDRTYGIKVWREGGEQPDDFLIQETMIDQEPFGSFFIAAHFVDVTIGDMEFRAIDPQQPLLVSDVLQGEDTLEPLLAANSEPADTGTAQTAGGGGSNPPAGPTVALSDLLVSDETAVVA